MFIQCVTYFEFRSERVLVILKITNRERFGNSGCDGFCMALILAVLVQNSHALYTVQVCILFCLARLAAEIRGNEVKSLHDTSGSLYSHNLHTSLFKGPPPRDREIQFSISNFVRFHKFIGVSTANWGKNSFVL
jgi:hypothetical protein